MPLLMLVGKVMADTDQENPAGVVDDIATSIFHLCANLENRMRQGEEIGNDEVLAIVERLKDYAADLQLAAGRLR